MWISKIFCSDFRCKTIHTIRKMGTATMAVATASASFGTLVNLVAGGGDCTYVTFGHPSGTLRVGAEAKEVDSQWTATKAIMSGSGRF